MNKIKQLGFTLIELLVAVSIIGILAAIGVVSYSNANESSRNSRRQSDIEQVRAALEIYRATEGGYPLALLGTPNDLATIVGLGPYLGGTDSIVDPLNNSPHVYTYAGTGSCSVDTCPTYTMTYYPEPSGPIENVYNP